MTCTDCNNLRKELEEQKTQTSRYESKIRDMVSAYKILETQKQSLEVALSVMVVKIPETMTEEEQLGELEHVNEQQRQILHSSNVLQTDTIKDSDSDNKHQPDQMEALKRAITTLTLINKRKEIEFKRDRKTLVETKDELQRRCEQLEQKLKEQRQDSKFQNMRRLREQLAEAQTAQERAMTEHGLMLAELQQQYGKEKRRSDNLEKQITEMSQRLATKDELIKRAEVQLKKMAKMEQEIQSLRKKAEMTPTVRVMRDELANVKASTEQEVSMLRTRYAMQSAQMREREARIEQMERRVHELSERCAQAEQQNIEFNEIITRLKRELQAEQTKFNGLLKEKLQNDVSHQENITSGNDDCIGEEDSMNSLLDKFRTIHQQLRAQKSNFDVTAALCLEIPTIVSEQRCLSNCSDVTGSLSIGVTPCSTPLPSTTLGEVVAGREKTSHNESFASLAMATATTDDITFTGLCDACAVSNRELDFFKNLIRHLQKKLCALEENHERTKKEHQSTIDVLHGRIFELESSQQRQYAQLAAETKQRVAELELELQKQRNHVLEIIEEKDREIELTKTSLAAFYSQNYEGETQINAILLPENQQLPMDPLQPQQAKSTDSTNPASQIEDNIIPSTIKRDKKTAITTRRKESVGSVVSTDNRRSSVDEQRLVAGVNLYHTRGSQQQTDFSASYSSATNHRSISRSNTLLYATSHTGVEPGFVGGAAARNIFYEQELCKREREIGELRNVIRLLELKMRDIEQAMLLKDVQYLQIIETLKEEIRVLEGRITLANSQTNLAYLRNIFVQFLNQGSATGRKHILRAIGAVLQLTPAEMQRVERWSH